MLKYYKIQNTNNLVETTSDDYDWANAVSPNNLEISQLRSRTHLDSESLNQILSNSQSNHIDGLSKDPNPVTMILQYPTKILSNFGNFYEYTTRPIVLVITNDNDKDDLITMSKEVPDFISHIISNTEHLKLNIGAKEDIILSAIYYLAREFENVLLNIENTTIRLEKSLNKATDNDTLYEIMSLQKTLNSFTSALRRNNEICNQIIQDEDYFNDPKYNDLSKKASLALDDTFEKDQYLKQVLEDYSSMIQAVVQNNQSTSINKLTVWSIVLACVSAVAGILGMNYVIPFASDHYMFYFVLLGILGVGAFIWYKLKNTLN